MFQSIAYVSRATKRIIPAHLDALLLDARMFNASVGVSGVLLFHENRFFQYFEGPSEGVRSVYERVRQATSHHNIQELLSAEMSQRHFDTLHMGFCGAPLTALQHLAEADWQQNMPITRDEYDNFEGVRLAVYYWNKWSADKGNDAGFSLNTVNRDESDPLLA